MLGCSTLDRFTRYASLLTFEWALKRDHVENTNQELMQSLSAIVGPNGSGKSNVIDAMLFVFGRRAKQVLSAVISIS